MTLSIVMLFKIEKSLILPMKILRSIRVQVSLVTIESYISLILIELINEFKRIPEKKSDLTNIKSPVISNCL